jgi:enoyl-CoA hydratase/carnithine racemase
MSGQAVIKEIKHRICVLTLNQPDQLNAMSDIMAKDFREAIQELKVDPEPKVVIVTGAGRAFSAGGNLQMISDSVETNPAIRRKELFSFYKSFLSVMDLGIPTIAAINGHAIGAGACLTLACDMRFAASSSKIGFAFAKIGLHPGMGAEYFLPRIIGQARAFELLMTGNVITADEAYRIGLINHVTSPEQLMDRVMELAIKIAAMPVLPIRMLKESIPAAMRGTLTDALHREATYQAICFVSGDVREGIDAVREKRAPRFSDEY